MKEILESAVCLLQNKTGTKFEILAMAEIIYPCLKTDHAKLKQLDKACSKYLEASPIQIMLLSPN
jgi:hypothetical protein